MFANTFFCININLLVSRTLLFSDKNIYTVHLTVQIEYTYSITSNVD